MAPPIRKYSAVEAFPLAARLDPKNLAEAYAALVDRASTATHFGEGMELDPVNLSAASQLIVFYDATEERTKALRLSQKLSILVQQRSKAI
jgi:lipopolysaccharide biosynthesis regulator YciM